MTEQHSGFEDRSDELVRTQDFETPHPIELDISNNAGSIRIELAETPVTHVEVRHDPSSAGPDWRSGLSGLLNWVSEQFGESGLRPGGDGPREPLAEAVHQTRIDLTGSRLAVRGPAAAPLRGIPLAIRITAPLESQIGVHTSGQVSVSGKAGRVQIQAASGDVSVDESSGSATVRTSAGPLKLGSVLGGVQARSGSGDVEIASIDSPSSVVTGSGNVWIGAVHDDVLVRSGSGDLTVADATRGQVELISGSGQLQVAVRRGVGAEVDLTSSTGSATSDLAVSDEPPAEEPPLRVFGRTGTGDALIMSGI
ncbi:DUF4097 family beta strand repeat protein [Saccharopolyspora erythraea]|uniref:DUF4097 family beta strand repeat-containing protein n=1 Tax=Saccharopolyspora erythraea TaxID=1836 RepID=UPI001BA73CFD|nr:DUF4097 family beta strand repeat-containing protein [Saccharopolyspora erythraea]QUH00933.1 DUF4097 family beta strand repeat protein [Saccharopolyspora erythraea]